MAAATAPATRGGINGISSAVTGGTHARCLSSDATPRPQQGQETDPTPPWHPARAPHNHRARTLHGNHARHRESRSAHATAAATAATRQHHARARRPGRRTHRTHTHSTAAGRAAPPNSKHHARTTTHDDEKMLRVHMGTKPETPIDGVCEHWAVAPATGPRCARGWPPFSSHASVAQTATRSSTQGPA